MFGCVLTTENKRIWMNEWMNATVCPTQWRSPALAGWLLWIVDVDRPSAEGHPKQRNRLDSSPGCLGAIYVRFDERDVLTPQCSYSSVWRCAVLLQCPGVALASCTDRAGLTMWWALRTPQRWGPTGKLGAEEGERGGEECPLPT